MGGSPPLHSDQLALADKMSELTNAGLQSPPSARLRAQISLCRHYWLDFNLQIPNLRIFDQLKNRSPPPPHEDAEDAKNIILIRFHGCVNSERATHETFLSLKKMHLIKLEGTFVLFFLGLLVYKQQQLTELALINGVF